MVKPSPSVVKVVTATPGLAGEVRGLADRALPLLVSGAPAGAAELRSLLTAAGGDPELVRQVGIADLEQEELAESTGLVYVIRDEPSPADERALRSADHHRLPTVCVVLTDRPGSRVLPYVLATDVLRTPALDEAAVDWMARRLVARSPDDAWALASRLPAIRQPVMEALAKRFSERNALAAATTITPGQGFPVLTLNQIRMTLRIAAVSGMDPKKAQALAVLASLGGGLALRAVSRRLSSRLPLPSSAVKAAVAYAGTRAIGLAATALAARVQGDVRPR
jgi:uncharacterized protein (DUF697 family)